MKTQIEVLEMIIADMESDVEKYSNAPFNGRTLGELHGILAATVQTLAKVMKMHIEECQQKETQG